MGPIGVIEGDIFNADFLARNRDRTGSVVHLFADQTDRHTDHSEQGSGNDNIGRPLAGKNFIAVTSKGEAAKTYIQNVVHPVGLNEDRFFMAFQSDTFSPFVRTPRIH
jgi:hypothetical protein